MKSFFFPVFPKKIFFYGLFLFTALCSLLTANSFHPWGQFKGNPAHTGVSPFSAPEKPELLFSFKTGGNIDSAPVVSADGSIYFGSWDSYFYALNSKGKLKWKYKTGDKIISSPALGADEKVFFTSEDSFLYALDETGNFLWKFPGKAPFSTPALDKPGNLYLGGKDCFFYSFTP